MGIRFVFLLLAFFVFSRTLVADVEFTLSRDVFSSPPKSMSLVGTFNKWDITATPMVLIGSSWTVRLQLPDGRHFYKFAWIDSTGKKRYKNDPRNPFIADNGNHGANNFVDVENGVRVENLKGLELFQWPPVREQMVAINDGNKTWTVPRTSVTSPQLDERLRPKKWVAVAGDFNDWRLGQFPLARCSDGIWRAYIPARRPFTYKIIVDGVWHNDPSNDVPPTMFIEPNRPPVEIPARATDRMPDGFGRFNSYREQVEPTSPALVTVDQPAPGNMRALDTVTSYIRSCDYGRAVAMARKIREANSSRGGELSARLAQESLALEAKAHKRWARLDDAAACWQAILAADRDTTAARTAANELASYHLFVTRDTAAARRICEWVIRKGVRGTAGLSVFTRHVTSTIQEHRYPETIGTVEVALANFPAPDGKDTAYACEMTELYLAQGISYFNLKEWDKARRAFDKVIEVHPWPDSQNVQRARQWLRYVEARKIDPNDSF